MFDPETVGSETARLVHDLPGGTPRLTAGSQGVVRVLVNGAETVVDGEPTGAAPGRPRPVGEGHVLGGAVAGLTPGGDPHRRPRPCPRR